jgi:hypothetical protein
MDHGKNRIGGDELLVFLSGHGKPQGVCPILHTLKSNSPFSAPRDDTARASRGNRAKSNFYQLPIHPWPLILGYRALLPLEPHEKTEHWLREAVNLAWQEDQRGTVRLIGAVLAAIAESRGIEFPNLENELFEIENAIPAATSRLDLLEDWREAPGSQMDLLCAVLPFNFH